MKPEEDHLDDKPAVRRRVGGSLFVCFAASIIEFATAADFCDTTNSCDDAENGWAIAVGVISSFICFIRLGLIFNQMHIDKKLDVGVALLLVILWAFGAAFTTRADGPFPISGNGFFSTCESLCFLRLLPYCPLVAGEMPPAIAFLAAIVYASMALPRGLWVSAQQPSAVRQWRHLSSSSFTSFVKMAVAADVCDSVNDCSERNGFAVAVGAIAAVVCIGHMCILRFAPDSAHAAGKAISVFLVAWWAAGAGVNTSAEGPFNSSCGAARGTANGYFSTWVAFFTSLYMCYQHFHPDPDAVLSRPRKHKAAKGQEQQESPNLPQQQPQQQQQTQQPSSQPEPATTTTTEPLNTSDTASQQQQQQQGDSLALEPAHEQV
ncbi:hypothetical protein PTSG_05366 [Salpingoeca rosetta]|uniref:Uncharacterized protein n=1 Tax=Salpingoeca rosetta (strain ATCC 50818 / BSB-021) TaxID=946362 RepID=F2UA80_SALR5|nr:uncharacterized protein PTSG_05366 [Salpingoeca rosetta]EGD73655.1 hypothetical protein PTSG_05366 [Salpingoeca rosetta]|eukprot:XP_004993936.1 hypothetical protein PTSG_05366 [Salpingoeca rosetta]